MHPQEKTESLYEYWLSFWPTAPFFGVRWRFAPWTPLAWPLTPFAVAPEASEPAAQAEAAEAAARSAEAAAAQEPEAASPSEDAPAAEAPVESGEAWVAGAGEAPEADPTFDAALAQAERARPGDIFETRPERVDDLKRIRGVGPKVETLLHELGVYTFEQIAGFDQANLAWVDERLGAFKGRPWRDDWTGQARALLER